MNLSPLDYASFLRLNVYTRPVPSGYDPVRLMLVVNDLAKYYRFSWEKYKSIEDLAKNGGFNKIRGISPSNPRIDECMQAAANYLGR